MAKNILTKFEVASLRNIFQANSRNYKQAEKLSAKIAELEAQKAEYLKSASLLEESVKDKLAKVGATSTADMFKYEEYPIMEKDAEGNPTVQKVNEQGEPVFGTHIVTTFCNTVGGCEAAPEPEEDTDNASMDEGYSQENPSENPQENED